MGFPSEDRAGADAQEQSALSALSAEQGSADRGSADEGHPAAPAPGRVA